MSGVAIATAAVAAVGANMYSSSKQAKATKSAARAQKEASDRSLAQQKTAFNKQNQKQVDLEGILSGNSAPEAGSTLLTGAGGVDQSQLKLNKGTNLLGG